MFFSHHCRTAFQKTNLTNSLFTFSSVPDGQQLWEMEATVDKDKSQPVRIKHLLNK